MGGPVPFDPRTGTGPRPRWLGTTDESCPLWAKPLIFVVVYAPPGTVTSRLSLSIVAHRSGAHPSHQPHICHVRLSYSTMHAGCVFETGTDLTQTSASGSFKSKLDLMHAYSDWASVYTLIGKSRAVRRLHTTISPRLGFEPRTSRIGSRRVATAPLTASYVRVIEVA